MGSNCAQVRKANRWVMRLLLLGGIVFQSVTCFAQAKDTTPVRDTLAVYKKIKKAFSKHRATELLYDAIFVDPAPKQYENKPLSDKQKAQDPKKKLEKKIIRNINITVFDPFGYSVHDTMRQAINSFQKLANHYHHTTRHHVIRNNLTFKKYDELDMLKINESERLIRASGYINDATIYITRVPKTDSVDIQVVVLDSWTVDAPFNLSFSALSTTLRDRNFLGFGQTVEQSGGFSVSGDYNYGGGYTIQNIRHTFITSTIFYAVDKNDFRQYSKAGISLERPFYSVSTKWAGGTTFQKNWLLVKYTDTTQVNPTYHLDNFYTDIWLGRSFNPGVGAPANRPGTNVIIAGRFIDTRFQKRPSLKIDSLKQNINTSLELGSLGFSLRKYYKDQFIYRFGATEDVPEGALIQILYGVKNIEYTGYRYYSGFQLSCGLHLEGLGYVSTYCNYGTLYNKFVHNNGTLVAGFYFFSNLLKNNKWYFRQFINLKYVTGINKLPTERIQFHPEEMYGFENGSLSGTSKIVINLEAVTYAPYNIIGFRFAPLLLAGFGLLESKEHFLMQSPVYQAYAVGLLLRNENLLNASFQVTYGVYPNLPDDSKKFGKFNPVLSFSIKVPPFTISKPSEVVYY